MKLLRLKYDEVLHQGVYLVKTMHYIKHNRDEFNTTDQVPDDKSLMGVRFAKNENTVLIHMIIPKDIGHFVYMQIIVTDSCKEKTIDSSTNIYVTSFKSLILRAMDAAKIETMQDYLNLIKQQS